MNEGEITRQPQERIKQLELENELLKAKVSEIEQLKAKIRELEARLAQYENAHTPPSLRRGRNRKRDNDNKGTPGQKIGHKGVTRPYVAPDSQVEVTADRCPDCGTKLGNPFRIESKIIEEIPEPQPVMVTEYKVRVLLPLNSSIFKRLNTPIPCTAAPPAPAPFASPSPAYPADSHIFAAAF